MVEWTHEVYHYGAGEHAYATDVAKGCLGRWRLFVQDYHRSDEPVVWHVSYHNIFFGGTEGRARTMEEGKQAAIAAAEAAAAEQDAWSAEMAARRAEG